MKELTIKEKAEAYDSMFERLKEMYNNNKTNVSARLTYERYFPELAESEDEKVRRKLISFFTARAKHTEDSTFNGLSSKEIIDWLEKQGEKKPWGEDDDYYFNAIISKIKKNQTLLKLEDWDIDWLKAIKDRLQLKLKREWSEQDEYNKRQVCRNLRAAGCSQNVQDRINSWLETFRFQTYWKPSKEQIAELQNAIGTVGELTNRGCILKELKAELVKLMRV